MTDAAALERMLTEAFHLHRAGDRDKAEQRYRQALVVDPGNLNALQLLGVLNHELGRHTDAVEMLSHAIRVVEKRTERRPEFAAVYVNFGNALRAVGRGDDALIQYRMGLTLNPDLAQLHVGIGDELCAQGDLSGAVDSYEKAKAAGALGATRLCYLGSAYALLKRFAEAEANYREALQPIFATIPGGTGFENPMLCFRPNMSSAAPTNTNKKDACYSAGGSPGRRRSSVTERYGELIDALPPNPDLYHLFAKALRDLGDFRAAVEMFELSLALEPKHIASLYELGISLMKVGFASAAIPYLEKAVELKPDFASFHVELGNALHFIGQSEHALNSHRKALQLEPLRIWKAKASPAEFSVLAIEGSGVGNTPPQFLLCNGSFDCHFTVLLEGVRPDIEMLARHCDVVVNLISEVDQAKHILPMAGDVIDRLGKPVINHPKKIMKTDRETTARCLEGVDLCRAPRTIRCNPDSLNEKTAATFFAMNGFAFPLLVRVAGSHGGEAFEKLHNADELALFLKLNPGAEYYVSEFVDYRCDDGYYRKYRFILCAGEIFPYHLAICEDWKVHHFRTQMTAHRWMQDEENTFLENPWRTFSAGHKSALRTIQLAFELEFFGVDCSIDRGGNLLIFEVNAAMLVHDDNAALPYKTPHCRRIKQAFHAMLAQAVGVNTKAAA